MYVYVFNCNGKNNCISSNRQQPNFLFLFITPAKGCVQQKAIKLFAISMVCIQAQRIVSQTNANIQKCYIHTNILLMKCIKAKAKLIFLCLRNR